MLKVNPCYRVTIYTPNETITITDPLSCHINLTRGILSESQNCTIQIYNLSPSTREKIFQDAFTFDPDKWSYVHVEGGYNGRLALLFKGRVMQAYSKRAGGQVDVITEIQAQYLDAIDSLCSYQFKAGTTKLEAFNIMATQIPNTVIGNIGNLDGKFETDTTFDGDTMSCLNELTGGAAHIDNGVLNCILNNEVIDVPVPIISDDTGLLDTPMRRDANLEVKMLFQPDLIVNQLLEIRSSMQPKFNGQFKVVGFTHDLNFGEHNSGTRTTTVNLYIGPMLPGANITTTDGKVQNNFNKVKGDTVTPVNPTSTGQKWIMPCKGRITSYYSNARLDPVNKKTIKPHDGIDIGAPLNTPVKACADGKISYAGWYGGYGKYISISHNGGYVSFYGHLNYISVSTGQQVKQGQIIGKVGSTGHSTGPHLHFGAKKNGISVNPLNLIK